MNNSVLYQIFESLETFILLKQQNFIIYSWMHLKNRNKRLAHLHHDNAENITQQILANHPQQNILHVINQKNSENSFNFSPRVDNRGKRLLTQNSKQFLLNDKLKHRMSDRLLTFTGKINRNMGSRLRFTTENGQAEGQDSDQFQDIVLQRLSKLQESINELMKDKKQKEEKRGYVGSPLKIPFPKANIIQQKEELSDPSNIRVESIMQRKKRFFESLRKNNEKHPSNIIHSFKYIPVNKIPQQQLTANIQRIKNLIQYNYQERLIEDIQDFNENNPRMADERANTHSRKLSTSLYMNRYHNGTKYSRDKIHYRPNDIQMQTVIQPRKRYFRQGVVNTDRNKSRKKSFISTKSVQARRNNLSSYN